MGKRITLTRFRDEICIEIAGKRATRFYLTEDQAQHLSNRLQSFAKDTLGFETVCEEELEQ